MSLKYLTKKMIFLLFLILVFALFFGAFLVFLLLVLLVSAPSFAMGSAAASGSFPG